MHIVLEGPDNAGKSSLARAIRMEVCNVQYYHPGGAPANGAEEQACLDQQWEVVTGSTPTILDRVTCVSQQVYNPDPLEDVVRRAAVNEMVSQPNVVFIYCRPPNEALMDVGNFTWRPEETEEHRQKIIERAQEFVERYDAVMLTVPAIFYDWTDEVHADLIVRKLVQAMHGREDAIKWFRDIIELRS